MEGWVFAGKQLLLIEVGTSSIPEKEEIWVIEANGAIVLSNHSDESARHVAVNEVYNKGKVAVLNTHVEEPQTMFIDKSWGFEGSGVCNINPLSPV